MVVYCRVHCGTRLSAFTETRIIENDGSSNEALNRIREIDSDGFDGGWREWRIIELGNLSRANKLRKFLPMVLMADSKSGVIER